VDKKIIETALIHYPPTGSRQNSDLSDFCKK